jgi:lipoprotein-anchoring transpeptidase ErfK/SrfK
VLSGRFRSLGSVKYWAYDGSALRPSDRGEEKWVRHQDVTVVQKRTAFPDFVKDETRWLDVSATTGTLVAYTGKRAVFVTLLSVARELPDSAGDVQPASDGPRAIPLGTFEVRQKGLTFVGKAAAGFGEAFEVQDAPWALELSSGQLLHGAYWHDRFGIEHGAGSFALSPSDAARIFRFVGPDLPTGWHAATVAAGQGTPVVIRK